MKPDELIRECILEYPSLFPNRLAVLNHLFSTIGGGYEWDEKEIVEHIPKEKEEVSILKAVEDRIEENFGDLKSTIGSIITNLIDSENVQDMISINFDIKKESLIKNIVTILDIENRVNSMSLDLYDKHFDLDKLIVDKTTFYIYSSSNICNIPDEVSDEWLGELEKYFNVLISNPSRVGGQVDLLNTIGERIQELKYLRNGIN